MKIYCVNYNTTESELNLSLALSDILSKKLPIIVCIGTDAVQGDSLGPMVGSLLSSSLRGKTYIFGTLNRPITAKEVGKVSEFIKSVYPETPVLAIDAALGKREEIGLVKVLDTPIKPGLGVDKHLSEIGTASIIGVVEEKYNGKHLLNSVRLSLIYNQARLITNGILNYFLSIEGENTSKIG